jgi:hypothetical protein
MTKDTPAEPEVNNFDLRYCFMYAMTLQFRKDLNKGFE